MDVQVSADATVGSVLDRFVGPRLSFNPDALMLAELYTYVSWNEYAVPLERRDTFRGIGVPHGSVIEIRGLAETPCAGLLHHMATQGELDVPRARDAYLHSCVFPYTRHFGGNIYDMRFVPAGAERDGLRGPAPWLQGRVIDYANPMGNYPWRGGSDWLRWLNQGRGNGRGRGNRGGRGGRRGR